MNTDSRAHTAPVTRELVAYGGRIHGRTVQPQLNTLTELGVLVVKLFATRDAKDACIQMNSLGAIWVTATPRDGRLPIRRRVDSVEGLPGAINSALDEVANG